MVISLDSYGSVASIYSVVCSAVAVLRRVVRIGNIVQLIFDSEEDALLFLRLLGLNGSDVSSGSGRSNDELVVQVRWSDDLRERFVSFLRRKKSPVNDHETIKKYIRCIERFLERSDGVITIDSLLKYVRTKHDNRALRNLLRFLYYYRYIDRYTYEELLSRVPRPISSGVNGLAEDYVPLSVVLRSFARASMKFNEELCCFYYALYYTGGQRMEQFMEALKDPQVVGICDKDYVRIRIHGAGTKTAVWAWIPKGLLKKLAGKTIPYTPGGLRAKLRKAGVVTPTYIRSFCWQVAKQLLGHDLALMLQGRVGELRKYTTALSYDNLVFQLDEKYSIWKKFVDELVENKTDDTEESIEKARRLREKYNLIIPI